MSSRRHDPRSFATVAMVATLTMLAVVLFSGASRGVARADGERSNGAPRGRPVTTWVVPPGQEAALATMLGGTGAIASCHYESANIERDHVVTQFDCGAGTPPVTLVLSHRGAGACPAVCTTKFVITDRSGDAPAAFMTALTESVSHHEQAFEWREQRVDNHDSHPTRGSRGLDFRSIAATVALVALAAFVIFRRVRLAPRTPEA
jgi:hypothetical protein